MLFRFIFLTQSDFGRLALSTYAHYLFGHVAATAAITNDQEFMDAMLSKVEGSYKAPTATDISGASNASDWAEGTMVDANIAQRLVKAVVTKNDAAILTIVEQVLGQDASRARDQDNNELTPGVRQELRFIAGDVIYMNIRLKRPEITVSNSNTNVGAPAANLFPDDINADVNYTLKITLEDKSGFDYAF